LKQAKMLMHTYANFADRLRRYSPFHPGPGAGGWTARLLSPPGAQEEQRRRAYLVALLLVAVVATAKDVSGLTESSATYTVYVLAIAISALRGFGPACVAVLASVLLVSAHAHPPIATAGLVVFALEGLGAAAVVAAVSSRVRRADAEIAALHGANDELREQARRGNLMLHALQHLEDIAPDAAVFLVNAQGLIVEWPQSAERMYGHTAEPIVGSSVAAIFSDMGAATDVQALLTPPVESVRRSAVHRRADGTRVHVEFEVRRCRPPLFGLFTVAVHDESRQRESEAFREAALRAQAALQKAADDAQGQLAVLESLTDPSVNPVAGPGAMVELLERLRSSVRADGIALVELGRARSSLVSGAGLRPAHAGTPAAVASSVAADGRVALVHNDPARVVQVSALKWSPTVSSIMVVPVCTLAQADFRLEVVNERRAPATEWDVALARIVADRLAQAIALRVPADSGNAVA
jgi:PAS domain S-box-containing protein